MLYTQSCHLTEPWQRSDLLKLVSAATRSALTDCALLTLTLFVFKLKYFLPITVVFTMAIYQLAMPTAAAVTVVAIGRLIVHFAIVASACPIDSLAICRPIFFVRVPIQGKAIVHRVLILGLVLLQVRRQQSERTAEGPRGCPSEDQRLAPTAP